MVGKFGLIGLWVTGYSFCENVHADRHCDPRDARLTVRLRTTDGTPVDCVELNNQNQGDPNPMRSLPREKACKRARWYCMRCRLGLGFLTLEDSVDGVLCPGCPTLSDSALCAQRIEMCSVSPSACLDKCSVDFGAKRRVCLALKPGCLSQGASA